MINSLLITQCLLGDFVLPIGKTDPLPNKLHIGYYEAMRLVGEDPRFSPLQHVINWAYGMSPEELGMIHIRDWHDKTDPHQAAHLKMFGDHSLQNTKGAEFIFKIPPEHRSRPVKIIDSLTLNDFVKTDLEQTLEPYRGHPLRVGVIGVWTEAKVMTLCYELGSRYPEFEIVVCSALTAGSSRAQHFAALNNLQRLYGVNVIDSVTDFVHFLGGEDFSFVNKQGIQLEINPPTLDLPEGPTDLIRYLFRDCSRIILKPLDGGFSGNYVLGTQSWDAKGRKQAPHVLKIGPQSLIARERTSFERVELIMGNNAPRIVDHADNKEFGAIKYRYASMGGEATKSLQKVFAEGAPISEIKQALDEIFINQLGRLYSASLMESCNLLSYYGFNVDQRERVATCVDAVVGSKMGGNTLDFFGRTIPNPANFYDSTLEDLKTKTQEYRYFADVHGDFNWANALRDANKNVWIIDFFHTHYGHILKDLIKFENDLLYILTPVENEQQLKLAMQFTDSLLMVKDLATPPTFSKEIMNDPHFGRTAETLLMLRQYYPRLLAGDIAPIQAMVGQMRYAVHTLSFEESSIWQKRWALYSAGMLSSAIKENRNYNRDLVIDWVPLPKERKGRLGLTILPGRKDWGRNLTNDIQVMKNQHVGKVISLVTDDELNTFGVGQLMEEYAKNGINAEHLHLPDGCPPLPQDAKRLVSGIDESLRQGINVVVHCVGGLGRSGTLVSYVLVSQGLLVETAIAEVRAARSPRAIETELQRKSIERFAEQLKGEMARVRSLPSLKGSDRAP